MTKNDLNTIVAVLISSSIDSLKWYILRGSGLIDANNIEDLFKFLKQTPALYKKQFGDYVSSRKNVNI